jgi:vesicle-associated membrane protein 4
MLDLQSRPDSKLSRVQNQVNDVIVDMRANVQKIVDRGQNLDELNDRSEELGVSADTFSRRSKGLRKNMMFRTCRARLYLAVAIGIVLLLIICKLYQMLIFFFFDTVFKYLIYSIFIKVLFYRAFGGRE